MTSSENKKFDCIIIGAGASGLMAAFEAAGSGHPVLVLERNDRAGKKLALTGNGKCNFTNAALNGSYFFSENVIAEIGNHSETTSLNVKKSLEDENAICSFEKNISRVFSRFSNEDILNFFTEIGIPHTDRNGYFYPYSGDAKAFRNLFFEAVSDKGAEFKFSERAVSVSKNSDVFEVKTENNIYFSDSVIISSGGLSYPKTGSTGDSYSFAKSFGISESERFPALVPLRTGKDYSQTVDGVRCHANVNLVVDNHVLYSESGEIQFNKDNVSGLPVLSLSGTANRLMSLGKKPYLEFDLFPESTKEKLLNDVSLYLKNCGNERPLGQALSGYLSYKLVPFVLERAGLNVKLRASSLSLFEIEKFISCAKKLRISISGSLLYDRAQTTTGGVRLSEIDIDTMESKKVPGLYFTGEALDCDGICGGYNLSWAFATGYIAGRAVTCDF